MRIALVFLALAGCAAASGSNATADSAPPPGSTAESYRPAIEAAEAPFRVPGHVTAHLNEEVRIGDVRVKPLEVVEDSRCPPDAACVWAGRLRLRVAINGAAAQVMEMNQPVVVAGGQHLTLVGALPIHWALPPLGVDPNAPKRFTFRLSGMD
jgi:hypothetical protein